MSRRILSVLLPSTLLVAATVIHSRPISPYLVGQNFWDGRTQGVAADRLWPSLKGAGFRIVRLGGIDNNESMPADGEISRQVDSIRSIGAEPLIQVSSRESPERAAALVRRLNVTEGRKAIFWSIGNEPTCGKAADAATIAAIAANIRARASAMKAVDPSIRIAVGDECYWRPELYDALLGGNADVSGKDASGRFYADLVALHSYPFPGSDKEKAYTRQEVLDRGAAGLRNFLAACTTRVALANARQGRKGADALACAITEFNITYWNVGTGANTVRGVGTRSFLNGQFMAEVIGDGARMGAFAVIPWSIYESGGNGDGSDLGQFEGQGPFTPRASLHHASLAALHLRGESLEASAGRPLLKAFAAREGDTVAVLLLNQDAAAGTRLALSLDGTAPTGPGAAVRVTSGVAGIAGPHADSIGPQSTLILRFHRSGQLLARIRYDIGMAEAGQGPRREDFPVSARRPGNGEIASRFRGFLLREGSLEGTVPEGLPWEIRLLGLDGREEGSAAVPGGGKWSLARPAREGLRLLVLRSGGEELGKAVWIPGRSGGR